MRNLFSALGIRNLHAGKTLDVTFPFIHLSDDANFFKAISTFLEIDESVAINEIRSEKLASLKDLVNSHFSFLGFQDRQLLSTFCDFFKKLKISENDYLKKDLIFIKLSTLKEPIKILEEAYFKLHLLSAKKVKPHDPNLDNLYSILPNIAWTNLGPVQVEDISQLKLKNPNVYYKVTHVDKFPYLINYLIPEGVRIADSARVRLGAYLGKGTTIMPAGYVNFNAGTLGSGMIEGRVSAGVVVGNETDIGGGASIMGTLSGGNKTIISIGNKCLIGANAGTGISLGFGCTIAAGVYITAGSKIYLYNEKKEPINLASENVLEGDNWVKGIDLSGREKLLFIQDSQTGKLKCFPNRKTIELNSELHENN